MFRGKKRWRNCFDESEKTLCCNARTNLKIKSLSSISNRNQNRSVNISWERNCATWQKFFHYEYIDCLTCLFSRLTVTKTFHSEYEEKKKNLKHSNAMARSNMEYTTLHTPSLCIKKHSWHTLLHKNKWFAAFECDMFDHGWVCKPAYSCTFFARKINWL